MMYPRTPFAIAALAAGKAVAARREALGHEPKPEIDTYPRFVGEAKQYRLAGEHIAIPKR